MLILFIYYIDRTFKNGTHTYIQNEQIKRKKEEEKKQPLNRFVVAASMVWCSAWATSRHYNIIWKILHITRMFLFLGPIASFHTVLQTYAYRLQFVHSKLCFVYSFWSEMVHAHWHTQARDYDSYKKLCVSPGSIKQAGRICVI